MGPMTIAAFLKQLDEGKLVDGKHLEQLRHNFPAGDGDPSALARELVRQGRLTAFQANQLLQGKELTVGPFLLLDRLGEGGMGQVYKARHQKLNRLVALKVIRPDRLASPELAKRFQREIRTAARLEHPHVVAAYDAGQDRNVHYFAMEYIEGTDLSRMVKEAGPLPVDLASDFVRQAALGLQAIHELGLVHRDIKPANLVVNRPQDAGAPVVKILDLGLARLREGQSTEQTKLTRLGSVVGTPGYLAPEQAMNASGVDIRADLYSLGCTLYFLLTGRPPFQGESALDCLLKHASEAPPSIRQFRAEVPTELQAILDRLLAKSPEQRFQTPAELVEALSPWCAAAKQAGPVETPSAHTGKTASITEEVQPRPRVLPRSSGRKRRQPLRWAMAVLVAAGLAGIAVALHAWIPWGEQTSPPVADPGPVASIVPSTPATLPSSRVPPKADPDDLVPDLGPLPEVPPTPMPKLQPDPRPMPKVPLPPEPKRTPKVQPEPEPQPETKPEPRKHPAPDAAGVAKQEASIREENRATYAGKKVADLKALAGTLLRRADQRKDDPTERYVLLHEAADVAAQAGEVDLALETLHRLETEYTLTGRLELRLKLLEKAVTWGPAGSIVEQAAVLAEEWVEDDDYTPALRSLGVAEQAARKLAKNSENQQLVAQLQTRKKEVDDLRKEFAEQETIKKARAELERNPHNSAANTVLGKYLCVRKDNWEEGLPLLAKGSDQQLKQAALLEAEPKKNAAAQVRLGNAWQQLAQRIDLAAARVPFLKRARSWYDQAPPGQLAEAEQVLVQNQIKSIDRQLAAEGVVVQVAAGQVSCAQQLQNARLFFERGRFAEATRSLKNTLETSEDVAGKERLKPYVRFAEQMTLAQGAAQRGRYADAKQIFGEAAGQAPDPDSGKLARYLQYMAQGWRAVQAGNQTEALSAFEAARKVLPSIQLRNTLRCSCQ